MNKSIKTNLLSALLCGTFFLNSCDPNETPVPVPVTMNNGKSLVPVNINILEVSYENSEVSSKKNTKEIHALSGDIGATEVERILENPGKKVLANGTTFKIVAYKKVEGNKYVWHRNGNFVVGKTNTKNFNLDAAGNYTLIIYSLGNGKNIPDLVNQSDFNNAYVDYTNAQDFLYQRIDNFRPSEQSNIDIRLKHELTSIKLEIDASDFYGGGNHPSNITVINNPKISYKNVSKAKFKISDASRNIVSGEDEVTLDDISFSKDANIKRASNWNNVIVNTSANNIVFSADIEMSDGKKYSLKVPIENIAQNSRQVIKLNLQLCGVNMKGGWKQFMCHDLGADYNAYPFKADKKLHGNKYQWGYPFFNQKYITSVEDQQNEIIDWNRIESTNSLEGDSKKPWTGKDPCPNGYRVPTSEESEELAELKFDAIGNISEDSNNYESGFILSEGGKLFFPTSGMRGEADGLIYRRGSEAWIWSSNTTAENYAFVHTLKIPAPYSKSITTTQNAGISIRCIKE